jgi:hypothetical protein
MKAFTLCLFVVLGAISSSTLTLSAQSQAASKTKLRYVKRQLLAMRELPFRSGDLKTDRSYNKLYKQRHSILLELVELISDETPREDPRSIPTRIPKFVVGDLAFFLVTEFEPQLANYDKILLEEIGAERIENRGPYAYGEWIKETGNRKKLQASVREMVSKGKK